MLKLKKATLTVAVAFTVGGGLMSLPPQDVSARTTYVWIAPHHGKKVSLFTWMPGIKSCRIKAPRDIALGKTSWISFVWLGTLKNF